MPSPSRIRHTTSGQKVLQHPLAIAGPIMKTADIAMGTRLPMNLSESGSDSQQPLFMGQQSACGQDDGCTQRKTGREVGRSVYKSKLPCP